VITLNETRPLSIGVFLYIREAGIYRFTSRLRNNGMVVFPHEKDTSEIMPLCYNAVTMLYLYRSANDNNNDNDDLRIVGRSIAG